MLFNSFQFLVFFPIVYLLYLFLNHQWQNRLLIVASCLFYAAWNWKFLGVMFTSITVDFMCARYIDKSRDPLARKLLLFVSIAVNLSILGFFKYSNFFLINLENLLSMLHLHMVYGPMEIMLPLGISFYTFEAISYVVDVYRRVVKPAERYTDYVLFVIYFPHLIAGPIMRAKQFLPQISNPRRVTAALFYEGSYLFFWGLFEKMFVADNLAAVVNPVFMNNGPYRGEDILLALYAFAFQIFCDFDGYSNMARGLGKCMGFDISLNFNLPYFSNSFREFWHRWHMTLSTWLRDYLYIPLGGSKKGALRMYAAIATTMLLGGLWHGASWTFVLWGGYQAVLLIIERMLEKKSVKGKPYSFIRNIICFHLIILGWLFFRAQSFEQISQMIRALLFNFHPFVNRSSWMQLGMLLFPLLVIQIWQFKSKDLMVLYNQGWLLKTVIYAAMTYLLIGWGVMQAQEFIYFQF